MNIYSRIYSFMVFYAKCLLINLLLIFCNYLLKLTNFKEFSIVEIIDFLIFIEIYVKIMMII